MGISRRVLGALLAALSLFAATAAQCAEDVDWIVPPQASLVPFKTTHISGYFKKPYAGPAEVTVKYLTAGGNAKFPLTFSLENKVFDANVELKEGINDIVLGSGVLSLLYLPASKANVEGKFTRREIHNAAQRKCDDCHSVWQGELALNDEFPALCIRCHKNMAENPKAPLAQNEHTRKTTKFCIGCHQPHTSENKFLLKRDSLATCVRCHDTLKGGSGHGVKDQKQCMTCHDPHGSVNPKMLLKPTAVALCLDCHKENGQKTAGNQSFHKPAVSGQCLDCHSSHPRSGSGLLWDKPSALCQKCHKEVSLKIHEEKLGGCDSCHVSHQSEFNGLVRKGVSRDCETCHQDKASFKGHLGDGRGECVSCHNPHKYTSEVSSLACGSCHTMAASEFQNMHGGLPMDKMSQCAFCHDPHLGKDGAKGKFLGKLHYPTRSGGCEVCHLAENGKIALKYAKSENCYRCHGDTVGTSSVMNKDTIHKPVAEDACTACHDPHLLRREKMLLIDPKDLCKWCHGEERESKKILHAALKDKNCKVCHMPHISDFKPLLKDRQPDICINCHKKTFKTPPAQDKLSHGVVKQGKCGSCHDPHSENNKELIRGGADEACKNCHPKVLQDDKGNVLTKFHGPVASGSCTACHELRHSHRFNKDDKFLTSEKADRVCDGCHQMESKHIPADSRIKERTKADNCLVCHDPHGAKNSLMLKRISY